MMKKFTVLSLLLMIISGCAGSKTERQPASITFVRYGGFSGLEDRYTLDESGRAKKTRRFPDQPERTIVDTTLITPAVRSLFEFVHNNVDSLFAIRYDETGNMTTALTIQYGQNSHTIRWPNLEPPILATKKLDTLYSLVSPMQEWLSSSR
jgi:hypothetical protein